MNEDMKLYYFWCIPRNFLVNLGIFLCLRFGSLVYLQHCSDRNNPHRSAKSASGKNYLLSVHARNIQTNDRRAFLSPESSAYEISYMGNILKHYTGFPTLFNNECLNLEIFHVHCYYHVHLMLLFQQLQWQFLQLSSALQVVCFSV